MKIIKKAFISLFALCTLSVVSHAQTDQMFEEQHEYYNEQFRQHSKEGKLQEAIQDLLNANMLCDTTTVYKSSSWLTKEILKNWKQYTFYDLACLYARVGDVKSSLKTLDQAFDCGFRDYYHVMNDEDLVSLRENKTFLSIIKKMKEYGPLRALKNSSPYAHESSDNYPHFTYQSQDTYTFKMVREYFNLNNTLANMNELEKITYILKLVHDNIRHNGNSAPFCERDAIDIYNFHKATGNGVNCRYLAIVVSELCMSVGIPARFVTCKPFDPNDSECHVINAVWSNMLNKWLWIDPTNYAWVMDENNNPLSIQEVRERLIDGRPLVLNSDANWNNEQKAVKEQYLDYYMAKNLYYIECSLTNGFNVESSYRMTDTRYIRLVPSGTSVKSDNIYITSDAEQFWAKPEM